MIKRLETVVLGWLYHVWLLDGIYSHLCVYRYPWRGWIQRIHCNPTRAIPVGAEINHLAVEQTINSV